MSLLPVVHDGSNDHTDTRNSLGKENRTRTLCLFKNTLLSIQGGKIIQEFEANKFNICIAGLPGVE